MSIHVFVTRRDNLRSLVLERFDGNRAAFSRAAGVNQNQTNLLLSENEAHRRNLGEALARRIESELGLVVDWLDEPRLPGRFGTSFTIKAMDIPPELLSILSADDGFEAISATGFWAAQIQGKVTAVENLVIAKMSTQDMKTEIPFGTRVILDIGVQSISIDGVYIFERGHGFFVRRVTKMLTGGWDITAEHQAPMHVESLKGLKAAARIVCTHAITMF